MNLEFELEEVSDRILVTKPAPILHSIAGGIALNNFIVVFDPTMFPATAKLLRQKLEQKFNLPTKFLCISHYHGDHAFGLAAFKDINVISSTNYVENVENRKKTEWRPEDFEEWKKESPEEAELISEIEIITPTVCIEDSLIIRDEDLTIEFKKCAGHTNCSAYAYVSNEKVLFAGDMIFSKQLPYAGDPTCDPEIWINYLENILTLDFEKLVPGHGPVCDKEEVKKHLEFFKGFKYATISTIKNGLTFKEIKSPEFYATDHEWLKESNLEHWYNYYKKKLEK